LLPEKDFDFEEMCHEIVEGNLRGKVSWIIITAEGKARGEDVARKISDITGLETRAVVLGHIQRGGSPTAIDRIIATRLGAEAVDLLIKGESGKAVGITSSQVTTVDLEFAVTKKEFKYNVLYKLIKILT
jgi:6-phosphofructokinase 1